MNRHKALLQMGNYCGEHCPKPKGGCFDCWVGEARIALEKAIPAGYTTIAGVSYCPVCKEQVDLILTDGGGYEYKCKYCPECGQRLEKENEK